MKLLYVLQIRIPRNKCFTFAHRKLISVNLSTRTHARKKKQQQQKKEAEVQLVCFV